MDGLTIAASRPRRARKGRVATGDSEDEYAGGGGGGGGGRRLRIRVGQGGGGPGPNPVDSVGWDRELDSDPDEPLAVEEHFILRVPPELAPRLKEQVDRRDLPPDTWFKFKDSRRAVFHLGKKLYGAKLVDLPALLESQRLTGVGGQTVKVADVSQMLLVEEEIQDETQATRDKVFNIEDFVYPHGITPPMKHVRKRRFRRRINRRTIEQVEAAVEKLLEGDARAEQVQVEMLDYDVPSDDEDYDPTQGQKGSESAAPTPRPDGAPSSPAPFAGDDESQRGGDEYEDESDGAGSGSGYDSDLAKEIEKDLGLGAKAAAGSDDSDDDGDGLFGGSSDDDEDDEPQPQVGGDAETLELRNQMKEAAEAMSSLDKAIGKKEGEIAKATNVLFKKRFEAQLRGLVADRKTKSIQHDEAARELDRKRQDAAAAATAEATDPPSMSAVVQPVVGGTPAQDAMDQSHAKLAPLDNELQGRRTAVMAGHAIALLGAHGLARLPEELVDLICSFVLTFEVKDTITTLCSLALTSRRFLERARRALLHDPSRILATRTEYEAHLLLNRIIRRPALGTHLKRLDGLVDMHNDVPELTSYYRCPLDFLNWAYALLRYCKNVFSIAVWPDANAGWREELDQLPRLRHVVVQTRCYDGEHSDDDIDGLAPFLSTLKLDVLHSLSLREFFGPISPFAPLHVACTRLELVDYYGDDYDEAGLGLCLGSVRDLVLKPHSFDTSLRAGLPASLDTLVLELRPGHFTRRAGWQYLPSEQWLNIIDDSSDLRNLRDVVFANVEVDVPAFAGLCAAAPNLKRLELRNSRWDADDFWGAGAAPSVDARFVGILQHMPRLRFLHLGELPCDADSILDTRVYCQLFDIELEWRTKEVVTPQVVAPDDRLYSRSADWDEYNDGATPVPCAPAHAVPAATSDDDDGGAFARWPFWRSTADEADEADDDPLWYLDAPSSLFSRGTDDALSFAHYPHIYRSPTISVDGDSVSSRLGLVRRTAAEEQRYVDPSAWEPHLESGHQAGDDGVDEELGGEEDEPWLEWVEECDISGADRAWAEYDDEGWWECARECWQA